MDLTRLQCELQWFTHGWSSVVIEKSKKKLQRQIGIISIWIIFLTDPPNWRNECLKSLSDSFGFCFYLSWFFFTTTWICSYVNKRCLQLGSHLYTVNTLPFLYKHEHWVGFHFNCKNSRRVQLGIPVSELCDNQRRKQNNKVWNYSFFTDLLN